jgi:hypothetical protein
MDRTTRIRELNDAFRKSFIWGKVVVTEGVDFEADNFDITMVGVSITLDRQKKGMFSTPIGCSAMSLKAFVDQWLHIATEDGSFRKVYAAWFD